MKYKKKKTTQLKGVLRVHFEPNQYRNVREWEQKSKWVNMKMIRMNECVNEMEIVLKNKRIYSFQYFVYFVKRQKTLFLGIINLMKWYVLNVSRKNKDRQTLYITLYESMSFSSHITFFSLFYSFICYSWRWKNLSLWKKCALNNILFYIVVFLVVKFTILRTTHTLHTMRKSTTYKHFTAQNEIRQRGIFTRVELFIDGVLLRQTDLNGFSSAGILCCVEGKFLGKKYVVCSVCMVWESRFVCRFYLNGICELNVRRQSLVKIINILRVLLTWDIFLWMKFGNRVLVQKNNHDIL